MSQRLGISHALIDVEAGGVILANMLADWLDEVRRSSSSLEAGDEFCDQRTKPEQDCLRLCAAINVSASAPSPGEYGTPVCTPGQGSAIGLERARSSCSGPGSGEVGSADHGARGFQDTGGGRFDGTGWSGFCVGSLAAGAFEFGLASVAGTVCINRYPGDRRRWLLRSGGFQRRITVGVEGDDGSRRTASVARAPPRWQAQ